MSYADKAIEAVKLSLLDVRPQLIEEFGNVDHRLKSDTSPVTWLDDHIETLLKDTLKQLDPDCGFYGEEQGTHGNKERFWLLDPIDGTSMYIRGLPFCTNMLCLIEKGEPTVSIIYNFILDEFYTAIKGRGAYKNGKRIYVSNRRMDRAGIEFESRLESSREKKINMEFSQMETFRFRTAGYGYTQVATGAIEARIVLNGWGQTYDFAPGALLVKEAGGVVANIGSDRYDYKNLDFIASNKKIYPELVKYFALNVNH